MHCGVILLNLYTLRLRSNLRHKSNRKLRRGKFDVDTGFMFIKIADKIIVDNTAVPVACIFLRDRDRIAVCIGIRDILPACAFVYLPLIIIAKIVCCPFRFC